MYFRAVQQPPKAGHSSEFRVPERKRLVGFEKLGCFVIACHCVLMLAPTEIEITYRVSFNVWKTESKSIIFQLDYQKEHLISPIQMLIFVSVLFLFHSFKLLFVESLLCFTTEHLDHNCIHHPPSHQILSYPQRHFIGNSLRSCRNRTWCHHGFQKRPSAILSSDANWFITHISSRFFVLQNLPSTLRDLCTI